MKNIITVHDLDKVYPDGFRALTNINLHVKRGEIFALLGPNGAGKTTLISTICGLINATTGSITIDGYDHKKDYRLARSLIGLVPQELLVDPFLTIQKTLQYQRGIYGKPHDQKLLEKTLRNLALWDKRHTKVRALSGGMKRRVLIGKALMNEPAVLFLDEPTAGVDIELRRDMWDLVRKLQQAGTTIILTTHYLEEAEEMADRIAIMVKGKIKLIEEKQTLLKHYGGKSLTLTLDKPLHSIPQRLQSPNLTLSHDGKSLTLHYAVGRQTGITTLLTKLKKHGITISDVTTSEVSLEDIFVTLINQ